MSSTTSQELSAPTTPGPPVSVKATNRAKAMAILNRLSAVTSTLTGLDGALMLAQYSTPIVIALLLRLSKLRNRTKGGIVGVRTMGLVEGLAAAGGGIGDARTVMRAFGMFPIMRLVLLPFSAPSGTVRDTYRADGPG
jgi:hypothetical protein